MKRWQFWLILVPVFAWFGRGHSQTQLNPSQIRSAGPSARQLVWSEFIASQSSNGTYLIPLPVNPPGTNATVVTVGPTIFRNNARQNPGIDYSLTPTIPQVLTPLTPWLASDAVLVEYWQVINNGPSLAAPSLPALTTMRKSWIRIRRILKR